MSQHSKVHSNVEHLFMHYFIRRNPMTFELTSALLLYHVLLEFGLLCKLWHLMNILLKKILNEYLTVTQVLLMTRFIVYNYRYHLFVSIGSCIIIIFFT